MRRLAISVSVFLALSGCTMSEVNEVALFDYEKGDRAHTVALKTLGNVTAGAVALPVLVIFAAIAGSVQNGARLSGGVSGGRVTVSTP